MSAPDLTCDVCHTNKAVGVASSSMGPVSWDYCSECLAHNAEPAIMFTAALDGGGAEGVAEWVRSMNTFVGGEYVSFDSFASKLARGQ